MIDWKRKAAEIAKVALDYEKDKEREDRLILADLAKEIQEQIKKEDAAHRKFLEWWKCQDRIRAKELYEEYFYKVRTK